jgi:hypothetical protein
MDAGGYPLLVDRARTNAPSAALRIEARAMVRPLGKSGGQAASRMGRAGSETWAVGPQPTLLPHRSVLGSKGGLH